MNTHTHTHKFAIITTCIILITIATLIAWDIVAFLKGGSDATISWVSITFFWAHPVFPFAAGILLGHLTWSKPVQPNHLQELVLLGLGIVALLTMDWFHVLPAMMPLWPFLVGIPVGHAFFAQPVTALDKAIKGTLKGMLDI